MIINNVIIKGFRSIKDLTFQFSKPGVTFVQGLNGAGKSTIFEALYWGLYGQSIKDSTLAELKTKTEYRDGEWEGTRVIVEFYIDETKYQVFRTLDFGKPAESSISIYKDHKMVPIENKANAQEILTNIIGINAELFKQSIFFAQKSLRLVDKTDAQKRDILDTLFDVEVDKYIENAKKEAQDVSTKIALVENKYQTAVRSLTDLKSKKVSDEQLLNTFDHNKKLQVDNYTAQVSAKEKELSEQPTDIPELVPPVPFDDKLYNEAVSKLNAINTAISNADYRWKSLQPVATTCPTCGGDLKPAKIAELQADYVAKVAEYEKIISDNKEQILKVDLDIMDQHTLKIEYDRQVKEFGVLQMQNQALTFKRKQLETELKGLNDMLAMVASQTCHVNEGSLMMLGVEIDNLESSITTLSANLAELKRDLDAYQYWASVGFGAKGIKAYIFQAMLTKLNTALRIYGEQLGIYVSFDVKTDTKSKAFSVVIETLDGVKKSYSDLSGGEQRRVDVIVSFALHDLVCDTKQRPSIMVLDEPFEGLDEPGLDIAMQLIRNKAHSLGVYLITHNINVDISWAETLQIKKVKNITCIE
ncbi:MAG: AAA family ATPase [Saprospiraceae bacterium]|nr:AAA family ATPase [Saprospiraceae bacterium]